MISTFFKIKFGRNKESLQYVTDGLLIQSKSRD